MQQRIDPMTGNKFYPTRINQRFETKQNRIDFWNKISNEIRHKKSAKDRPLHLNFLILTNLMQNRNEAIFNKHYLLGKGFKFGCYTHIEKFRDKTNFGLYDFIIVTDGTDNIKIVRNDR